MKLCRLSAKHSVYVSLQVRRKSSSEGRQETKGERGAQISDRGKTAQVTIGPRAGELR